MENKILLKTVLGDRFKLLPKEIQEIFNLDIIENTVSKISKHYNLNEAKSIQLENEIILVLFFYEPITNLENNIQKNLNIAKDASISILFEIKTLILYRVLDLLEKNKDFIGIRNERTTLTGKVTTLNPIDKEGLVDTVITSPKPITRKELMQSLSAKHTMQDDIKNLEETKKSGASWSHTQKDSTSEVKTPIKQSVSETKATLPTPVPVPNSIKPSAEMPQTSINETSNPQV